MCTGSSSRETGRPAFLRMTLAMALLATVLLLPGKSFAAPTTGDRGNEGERPVPMTDPFFWENGNLFCDRGLKATGFRVLPDMTIQGAVISKETLEALAAFPARADSLKAQVQGLGWGDFLKKECLGDICVYLPDFGANGWKLVGNAAGFLSDVGGVVASLPDFMKDILGPVPNLPLKKSDWEGLEILDVSSFVSDLNSFKSFFDGTFFVNLGLLVADFVDPPATSVCENHSRRQAVAGNFRDTWAYWALQNQRKQLQADVPVSKVVWIGAHNAYNNYADGYLLPNNWYSITDLLRSGTRFLALDVYHGASWPIGCSLAQLSHAGKYPTGAVWTDRYYYNAIKEIRNWMLKPENADEVVWIEMQDGVPEADSHHINDPIERYLADEPEIGVFTPADYEANGSAFPSQRELVATKRRAICIAWNSDFGGEYVLEKPGICVNKYGKPYVDFDRTVWPPTIDGEMAHPESVKLGEIAGNRLPLVGGDLHPITEGRLAELVRYNVNFIGMDMVLHAEEDFAPGDRLKGAVWSWREGEWEAAGVAQAALMGSDGRWGPRSPYLVRRFAAARPTTEEIYVEGELVEVADTWEWVVTQGAGTWFDGGRAVYDEFGPEYTFFVPLNGHQNRELTEANLDGAELWLNYGDLRTDGIWEINTPPVAVIEGPDTAEEGDTVSFSGAGSHDADDDALVSFEWDFDNGDSATGSSVTTVYGDDHTPATVTLLVIDELGSVGLAEFPITVFNLDPAVTLDVEDAIAFAGGDAFLGRTDSVNVHSASATDEGSDDLTFTWSLDDLVFPGSWVNREVIYFNNGASPDPMPSSAGTFPFAADDTADSVTFESPGVFLLRILVTDDDGGTDTFVHTKLVMGAETFPKGLGYWRKQFSTQGRHDVDDVTLLRYLAFVDHASGVFPEFVPASSIADARAVMQPGGTDVGDPSPSNQRGRLAQTVLQAWLNFASGAIGWDPQAGRIDAKCLQTIYACEQVLTDPGSTHKDCVRAMQALRSLF